jgi:hypothetical protein
MRPLFDVAIVAPLVIGLGIFLGCLPANPPVGLPTAVPTPANPRFIPPPQWLEKVEAVVASPSEWDGSGKAQAGDEIWTFSSPPETWEEERGTKGKCLLRGTVIVDGHITLVS